MTCYLSCSPWYTGYLRFSFLLNKLVAIVTLQLVLPKHKFVKYIGWPCWYIWFDWLWHCIINMRRENMWVSIIIKIVCVMLAFIICNERKVSKVSVSCIRRRIYRVRNYNKNWSRKKLMRRYILFNYTRCRNVFHINRENSHINVLISSLQPYNLS